MLKKEIECFFFDLNTDDNIATPCSVKTIGLMDECFKLFNRSQFVTSCSVRLGKPSYLKGWLPWGYVKYSVLNLYSLILFFLNQFFAFNSSLYFIKSSFPRKKPPL